MRVKSQKSTLYNNSGCIFTVLIFIALACISCPQSQLKLSCNCSGKTADFEKNTKSHKDPLEICQQNDPLFG